MQQRVEHEQKKGEKNERGDHSAVTILSGEILPK
jgi:hypothetical protein